MIYTDDTIKIAIPDAPQRPSASLILPAYPTAPQPMQATSEGSHEPVKQLDGLLLHDKQQREFKLVMILIFCLMLASAVTTTVFLFLAH